ncbi:IPTL-CTERM sorting domain-containing protein [Ottowia thiooxydans]|uniref:IPTL-CTERM sorting domain-containing protein n=1 Tax=Ottowia thiooxydans TaxID=219182 RepID=UPI0003FC48AA|nr:IPTL-CTERM sorting domain-containing protein [Ottowia thiooxydans]
MTTAFKSTCRAVAAALALCASAAWGQTTYDYNGPVYGAGAIAPYTAAMNTSGWVRLNDSGLPANTGMDIRTLLTDWSLSDGVITFTPANSEIFHAYGYTNASSAIAGFSVSVMRPLRPHTSGQRIDSVHIFEGGDVNVRYNGFCSGVDPSTTLCGSLSGDDESAIFATYAYPGNLWRIRSTPVVTPTPTPTAVPTLGEWGLLLTGLLVAGVGAYRTSSRRR